MVIKKKIFLWFTDETRSQTDRSTAEGLNHTTMPRTVISTITNTAFVNNTTVA